MLTNARYPGGRATKKKLEGVTLGNGCKVGANATLLPGTSVGERALVGAGAVVTKDVEPGRVVYGNPACPHANVSDIADYD